MDKKQDPSTCCLQQTHFRDKDTHRVKVREWRKIFHANRNDKKSGVAIRISDKIDFKTKAITKEKEHCIMIKEPIEQEDITFIIIYARNIGTSKYIKQMSTDIKGEIDKNTVIVGDFNTPFTSKDRQSRKKINE